MHHQEEPGFVSSSSLPSLRMRSLSLWLDDDSDAVHEDGDDDGDGAGTKQLTSPLKSIFTLT